VDQLRIMLTSGLYDECEEISIGCLGPSSERAFFEKHIISQYPKLKIKYHSENPLEYEFPTLRLIEDDRSDYVGFYIHTKGVTRPFESVINHWRVYLNEMVLARWREHRDRVENGYDVSSCNFLKSPDHFSGNFWWFRSSYINECPAIDTLDLNNRWHAEQYICMRHGNFYSIPHIEPSEAVIKFKY